MRKVSLALIGGFLLTGSIFANIPKETDPAENLKAQVKELLSSYSWESEKNLSATILFTINAKNEFVVLSVDTTDEFLEYYVKTRLNYQKVNSEKKLKGRRYTIPIKMKG